MLVDIAQSMGNYGGGTIVADLEWRT